MTSSAGGRVDRSCRSCTGSTAATTSPSASSATSAAGATRARCESATAHGTRRSSTSTASCSTRCPRRRAPRRPAPRDAALHRRPRRRHGPALGDRDAGMWEMRGEPRHHLSSQVMCWVALDRAVRLAPKLGIRARRRVGARARPRPRGDPPPRLERAPRRVRAGVRERPARRRRAAHAARGLPAHDRPAHARDDRPDRRRLAEDELVLRYRNEDGRNADGLRGEEGTFVCARSGSSPAWRRRARPTARGAVQAADRRGERPRAARRGGDPARESSSQLPGVNHIGLIVAASHLDRARASD